MRAEDILCALALYSGALMIGCVFAMDEGNEWLPFAAYAVFWLGSVTCHQLMLRFGSNRADESAKNCK